MSKPTNLLPILATDVDAHGHLDHLERRCQALWSVEPIDPLDRSALLESLAGAERELAGLAIRLLVTSDPSSVTPDLFRFERLVEGLESAWDPAADDPSARESTEHAGLAA